MPWHPIVSVLVGLIFAYYVIIPWLVRRRRRKRDELEAWKYRQRMRG